MPTPLTLQLESALGRAHRALFASYQLAASLERDQDEHDLMAMMQAVEAMQESLLRRGGHLRTRPRPH